jgi:hypothetical protein
MLALTKSTTKQIVPHMSLLGFSKFISPVIRRWQQMKAFQYQDMLAQSLGRLRFIFLSHIW